jgi:hypothetical protein
MKHLLSHTAAATAALLLALLSAAPAGAAVVRPAPDIALAPGSKPPTVRGIRGQQVVVVFEDSPSSRKFRAQVKTLEPLYRIFAAREVLFVAAFADPNRGTLKSSIPFLVAADGAAAKAAYGLPKGGVAILSSEGNLDFVSSRFVDGRRVREVLLNSQPVQAAHRKQ